MISSALLAGGNQREVVEIRCEECKNMDERDTQEREDGRSAVAGHDAALPASGEDEQSDASAHDPQAVKQRLFAERIRIEQLGRVRQLVFGSLDGLLVPLGVVS